MCKKKKNNTQANQLLILPLKMFMELCLRVTWYSLPNYSFHPSIFPSSTWCEFCNDAPFGCNTLLPSYFYIVFAALLSLSVNRNPVAWWGWLLQHLSKHESHSPCYFFNVVAALPSASLEKRWGTLMTLPDLDFFGGEAASAASSCSLVSFRFLFRSVRTEQRLHACGNH